ncbi:MAG: lysophospholipid acyltransferase family protein [Spirochaetota bacterium]
MKRLVYNYLSKTSRLFGIWIFLTAAWWISTGYFLLFPGRVKISMDFYKALFPGKSIFFCMRCSWKQFHNFTNVFIDRFILHDFNDITYTSEGWEHIEYAAREKTGGILVMSHIGNWEVAAHLLRREKINMLLYMGIKQKEQIERTQKESLAKSGLKIIAVMQEESSPFDILEGINFLKDGGLVSLTGDRIWRGDQRAVGVSFLGHKALVPETPYIFALLSGAPVFFFFTFRTGKKQYHFKISQPMYIRSASRKGRKEIIKKTAQHYAEIMEANLRQYPYEWFHFERFIN